MRALLIVDVQRDFTEGGALACAGGSQVAADISELLQRDDNGYELVVASRDWHNPGEDNGGHFADEPDFVNTWPVHCLAGTEGAQYHPNLDIGAIDVEVFKGMGEPAYSAFEGRSEDGQSLAKLLRERGVEDLDVVGIATDYCVRASARDALAAGFAVRVITGLTAAVNAEGAEGALKALEEAGAQVVATI